MNAAYDRTAVDQQIDRDRRAGRRISGREARLIHALLKGRTSTTTTTTTEKEA